MGGRLIYFSRLGVLGPSVESSSEPRLLSVFLYLHLCGEFYRADVPTPAMVDHAQGTGYLVEQLDLAEKYYPEKVHG